MPAFSPTIDELRSQVDRTIAADLERRAEALPEARLLIDEMWRLTAAGGKRLRPAFCYWGFRAAGGAHRPEIVRAASSLELLHTFAIVHDDIMDASDERRGEEAVHARHGVGVGILVGDLALVLADDAFMGAGFPPPATARAFAAYSRMRQEVIAGQYLDLAYAARADITVADARRVAVLKSGRYSIEEPLAIGAALAGAPDDFVARLAAFGGPLGEAFQLRDDLLGTFGDRSRVGKPVDSDIIEGKRNVLYAFAAASLEGESGDFLRSRWGGGGLSDDEIARLRDLVEASGARAATERLLDEQVDEALARLGDLALGGEERGALEELVFLATARRA
ncbi:MAG TPA: polyprenyl synthetase family protein [Actinomycetota bacterium]|nr:polyprenyl synthetase family protein [Actinomycetota bacterium]